MSDSAEVTETRIPNATWCERAFTISSADLAARHRDLADFQVGARVAQSIGMNELITTYSIDVHFGTGDSFRTVAKYAHGERALAERRAREYTSDAKAVRIRENDGQTERVIWIKPYAGMNR